MQERCWTPMTYAVEAASGSGDLLDTVASMLLFGGLLLTLAVADSWFWLFLVGVVLMAAMYTVKGIHLLRARRRPTA